MRKKEVRWISRDNADGQYKIWKRKPKPSPFNNYPISRNAGFVGYSCENETLKIKRGGLAKVTIERMY